MLIGLFFQFSKNNSSKIILIEDFFNLKSENIIWLELQKIIKKSEELA